jgi:hypothetical protein
VQNVEVERSDGSMSTFGTATVQNVERRRRWIVACDERHLYGA